ncbi:MAG: hypothetical protein GF329_13440 [Candidatus Lokiarchaeota archaeon]|nr:hypothetical protein [Candidatus Lokiarchaeota archaeon]
MEKDNKTEIKIEIIKSDTKSDDHFRKKPKVKRSTIPFKCPVCNDMILFKCEIPDDVKVFPYRIEYEHYDHVILIDLDNNHEIREIKPK